MPNFQHNEKESKIFLTLIIEPKSKRKLNISYIIKQAIIYRSLFIKLLQSR